MFSEVIPDGSPNKTPHLPDRICPDSDAAGLVSSALLIREANRAERPSPSARLASDPMRSTRKFHDDVCNNLFRRNDRADLAIWTAAVPSRTPSLRRQYKQYKQEKSGRAPQKHAAIPGQFQRAAEQQRRKRLAQAPLSQQPQNGESSRRGRFHHRPQNAQVRASPCAGNELTAKRNAVTSPRATQAPPSPRIRSASGSMRRLRSHCRPCRSCPAGQIS